MADQLGCNHRELRAGVDVESADRDTPVDWNAIAPTGRDPAVDELFTPSAPATVRHPW
ncbi:hypothetical protein ACFVT2_27015 [Streptomyces sp. NPDC058000]|uniref:hypothetical protein n=1 Tax=Streptomyces sp. NPDC058000 TaxID=3346299 RepID=UPI0036EDA778